VAYDLPIIIQSIVAGPDHIAADLHGLLEAKIVPVLASALTSSTTM
jgi:hypothetical protein